MGLRLTRGALADTSMCRGRQTPATSDKPFTAQHRCFPRHSPPCHTTHPSCNFHKIKHWKVHPMPVIRAGGAAGSVEPLSTPRWLAPVVRAGGDFLLMFLGQAADTAYHSH